VDLLYTHLHLVQQKGLKAGRPAHPDPSPVATVPKTNQSNKPIYQQYHISYRVHMS